VFVDLPQVGIAIAAGDSFSEVESTKSVSEIYAPVGGTIIEVNNDLADFPQRLNEDPYGEGWICIIEPSDVSELEDLLDGPGYLAHISG
jgi:glycine cleavage system H protein